MEESKYLMHTYNRFNIEIESGEGCYLKDTNGKEYLDLTSGIGVNCLGHNHPVPVEAIQKQVATLMECSNLYYSKPMVDAAKKLVEYTGLSKVFFSNSGAEANEGMIKLARKYSYDKYGAGRDVVLRQEKGLSQQQLSDKLETLAIYICRGSISRIEDGSRTVTDIELMGLSQILSTPVEDFFK